MNKPYSDAIIDVVIPVYKAGEHVKELLNRLQKQKQSIHNIILMHTEDGQDLSWAVSQYRNVTVYSVLPEEFDHGGTRDRGIRGSQADIVVCMTQDALPADSHLIERLIQGFEQENVAISYARQMPKEDCDLLERYTRRFNYPETGRVKTKEDIRTLGIKTYFCSNVCAAYKKDVYLKLGGFEHKAIFNEDMIFAAGAIQQGYSIAYVAEAKVIHSHNYTNMQQFKRNFDLAVSQAQHPEIFNSVKSEIEGIRLIKQTSVYLLKAKHPFKIMSLIWRSAIKYLGYTAGKNYRKLPNKLVVCCTMNPRYWG